MRRRSTITLFTILLVLLVLSSSAAWSTWQRRNMMESSYSYATTIAMETLTSASASTLISLADPRFMEGWDEDGVQRYVDLIAARLGSVQRLTITGGGIDTLPLPFINQEIEAGYTMDLYFPDTTASAEIVLVPRSGSTEHWLLLDFRVDSTLLND